MMESFVRDPLRMAGYFGNAMTVALLVAVFVFDAPGWILALILVGGGTLFAQLSDRADRIARERGLR
jgi:hypothetical protein